VLLDEQYDFNGTRLADSHEEIFPKEFSDEIQEDELFSLSRREREIFQLYAEGLSIKDIAENLNISKKTVETHKYRIMEKLNISSMNEWIKLAIKKSLINV
jgi:RNA polymerase sigma factor (sigma-70 family)